MGDIADIRAREIYDSRGFPTLEVDVILADGSLGRAAVPSGSSRGIHEAVEKRDGQTNRLSGQGVLCAVEIINQIIRPAFLGWPSDDQAGIDSQLIEMDGTPAKERLGANTILAFSLAVAKAQAAFQDLPLYRSLGGDRATILPVPLMNILNGGKHADNHLICQEVMIVPLGAPSFRESVRMGAEVFHALKHLLHQAGFGTSVGDEGGFAPDVYETDQAMDWVMTALEATGFRAGKEIALALDMAASEFYRGGRYAFSSKRKPVLADQLIDYYEKLARNYPLFSLEDGLAEDDWAGWKELTNRLGNRLQLVGDDLFVTDCHRLRWGSDRHIANAILIKPNQIGTLTETANVIRLADQVGYRTILSHRSGETEDTTIADLSVAWRASQIKAGSLSRTDRLAKYNQLIRIEEDLGDRATFAGKLLHQRKNT